MKFDFTNLPDNLYVELKPKFRKYLFKKLGRNVNKISCYPNDLGCLISSFYNYRNGKTFIPIKILRQIIHKCNLKNHSINNQISRVKIFKGTPVKLKLPIEANSELATIVGHLLGDGHMDKSGRISYVNKRPELIKNFTQILRKYFESENRAIKRIKSNAYEIRFPAVIGVILKPFGIIQGSKTLKEYDIPKWIKNGNNEIKNYKKSFQNW